MSGKERTSKKVAAKRPRLSVEVSSSSAVESSTNTFCTDEGVNVVSTVSEVNRMIGQEDEEEAAAAAAAMEIPEPPPAPTVPLALSYVGMEPEKFDFNSFNLDMESMYAPAADHEIDGSFYTVDPRRVKEMILCENFVPHDEGEAIDWLTQFSLSPTQAKNTILKSILISYLLKMMTDTYCLKKEHPDIMTEDSYKAILRQLFTTIQQVASKLYKQQGMPSEGNVYICIPGNSIRCFINRRPFFKIGSSNGQKNIVRHSVTKFYVNKPALGKYIEVYDIDMDVLLAEITEL